MTVPSADAIASDAVLISDAARVGWTVIVPVKSTARGKSRIAVDPELRQALAIALATDTVTAVAAAGAVTRVLVVAEDPGDATRFAMIDSVRTLVTAATSLNAAILDGLTRVEGPVAVLPGDLPSLTGGELDAVLAAVDRPMMVVADRQGVGTTLLTAWRPADLMPRYGPDSFRRHRDGGAAPIVLPADSGIRRDVDTVEDLADVHGGRTAEIAAVLVDPGVIAPGVMDPGVIDPGVIDPVAIGSVASDVARVGRAC